MDLSIVIVNWNTRAMLLNCLQSLYRQTGLDWEIFVVDNGSTDGSPAAVAETYPEVNLIAATENLGFARANNLAFPHCSGRHILLLNSDTLVPEQALVSMVNYLDEHLDIGALGCELLYADGSLQSWPRSFPTVTDMLRQLLLFRPTGGSPYPAETCDADWVSGACLLVRKEILPTVGDLNDSYFMYAEDIEWCYRIKQAGWRIVYYSEVKVFHLMGKSNNIGTKFYTINDFANRLRFFQLKEQGLRGKGKLTLLRIAYILGGTLRVLGFGLLWLFRPQNQYYRDRVSAYAEVISIGLRDP